MDTKPKNTIKYAEIQEGKRSENLLMFYKHCLDKTGRFMIRLTENCRSKFEGNNPMVGATVACAVAVEECMK